MAPTSRRRARQEGARVGDGARGERLGQAATQRVRLDARSSHTRHEAPRAERQARGSGFGDRIRRLRACRASPRRERAARRAPRTQRLGFAREKRKQRAARRLALAPLSFGELRRRVARAGLEIQRARGGVQSCARVRARVRARVLLGGVAEERRGVAGGGGGGRRARRGGFGSRIGLDARDARRLAVVRDAPGEQTGASRGLLRARGGLRGRRDGAERRISLGAGPRARASLPEALSRRRLVRGRDGRTRRGRERSRRVQGTGGRDIERGELRAADRRHSRSRRRHLATRRTLRARVRGGRLFPRLTGGLNAKSEIRMST